MIARRRLRTRLLLVVLSPLVLLGVLEVVFRNLGYAEVHARYFDSELGGTRFYPNRTNTMTANGREVGKATINPAGFRGPWFADSKTPGIPRVAVIGDSVTFGWSVADDETFPAQLSDLLEHGEVPHEVVNLGVPGYNTENELALYRQVVRPHDPDVLILAVTTNDLEPTTIPIEFVGGDLGRWLQQSGLYGAFRTLTGIQHGLVHTEGTAEGKRLRRVWRENQKKIHRDPTCEEGRTLFEAWRGHFHQLLAEVTADGCRVLVVMYPAKLQFRLARDSHRRGDDPIEVPGDALGWQREIVRQCEEAGVAHLDLLKPLARTRGPYGKIDRAHPSPRGHRTIAAAIAEELLELGWVTPGAE